MDSSVSVLDEARVDEISIDANRAVAVSTGNSSPESSDELDDSDSGDAVKYASSSTDAVEIDRS